MRRMIPILLSSILLLSACGAAAAGPPTPPEHQLPEEMQPVETLDPGQMPELSASDLDATLETPPEELEDEPPEVETLPGPETERTLDPARPMVALTYDDGPHAVYTDQILDILEEHGAVATFFEVARNLPNAPDAVRRAAAMGCEVGSHSYRHADLGKMDKDGQLADQAASERLLSLLEDLKKTDDSSRGESHLTIRRRYQAKLSACAAHIRNQKECETLLSELTGVCENFFEQVRASGPEETASLLKTYDILLTQIAVLSGICTACPIQKTGGNITAEEAENSLLNQPNHTMEPAWDKVLITQRTAAGVSSHYIAPRPVPETDTWFENVYNRKDRLKSS